MMTEILGLWPNEIVCTTLCKMTDWIISAIKNLLDSKILKLDDKELDDIGLDDILNGN